MLLLGDGPLQEKIRQKTEILGIAESVVFAGLQKDPAPFYSAMDVFAFPSLWEGLGIVLLEAQYNGLPCVVSDAVPKEVVVSPLLEYSPMSVDIWQNKIYCCNHARDCWKINIQNDIYNINCTVGKLRMLYV